MFQLVQLSRFSRRVRVNKCCSLSNTFVLNNNMNIGKTYCGKTMVQSIMIIEENI